jgi:hypothetical protein
MIKMIIEDALAGLSIMLMGSILTLLMLAATVLAIESIFLGFLALSINLKEKIVKLSKILKEGTNE